MSYIWIMKTLKNPQNYPSYVICLIAALLGISMTYKYGESPAAVGVGCSLIASSLFMFLNTIINAKESLLQPWGLVEILDKRSKKGEQVDHLIPKAKKLDCVAFGMKSFRDKSKTYDNVLSYVNSGHIMRIITMDPDGSFVKQREKEENDSNICNTILELKKWAEKINQTKTNAEGKILIKAYSCMTLDFYWRIDNTIYVGPYPLKGSSQQNITYKYKAGKLGFDHYAEEFENLWNNENVMRNLV